jgi:hypothetical protein
MRVLRPSSEAEMVALFLRTELYSDRFGAEIRALLERDGIPERVVTAPDLGDRAENQLRRRILFEQRDDYFDGLPADVRWEWMAITSAELATVRYIDYSYWNELSGGSRLVVDAVPRIRAGVAPFGVPSDGLLRLSQEVAAGARFPPLILVTTGIGSDIVVMEGHVRLSAFMLACEHLPSELEVLVGSSATMTAWDCW